MKKILLLLLSLTITVGINADEALKREMRAAWVATVWGIDWPTTTNNASAQKAELRFFLRLACGTDSVDDAVLPDPGILPRVVRQISGGIRGDHSLRADGQPRKGLVLRKRTRRDLIGRHVTGGHI